MTVNRAFGDPDFTPDNFSSFSKQEVSADAAIKAAAQLEPVPPVRSTTPMDLAAVIGTAAAQKIVAAGKLVFHTVGDTGGIEHPEYQFAVADAMALDTAYGASFWYHLGDVVYFFGQDEYYFPQFYDPYRNYNAPIFAIPGNHDAVVFTGEKAKSLDAFVGNFCTSVPTNGADSQGASRTTMDQPGVYFTLNAPFAKFIGLYTNTGEGGTQGVISNSTIGTAQLTFLQQQLTAAKAERATGTWRALVLATHHPPFTGSPFHIPSPDMLQQIDQVCTAVGIWPDLHLSGHSHLYERYTRTVGGKQIPYVVAGMGGYYGLPGLKPIALRPKAPATPASGTDASGNPLTIAVYKDAQFGFMRMTVSPAAIVGEFIAVDPATGKTTVADSFTVNIAKGTVANGGSVPAAPPAKAAKPPKAPAKGKKAVKAPTRKAAAKKTPAKKIPAKNVAANNVAPARKAAKR